MIVYLDTSALVPLLVQEPTSAACGELWDAADAVTSVRLTYVESVAAVAQAERMGRLRGTQVRHGLAILDELWPVVDVIEFDQDLMANAAMLARTHGLRGYDATHCAAAVAAQSPELVATSGDSRLLRAWHAEGVMVRDPAS